MNRLAKLVCALAAMAATAVFAVEVTPEQAQTAVRNWIRKNPRPMTAQFATGNGEAKTFKKDDKTLFHVVQLEGGGFVVTSGDTKIAPIVAFSDDGFFDPSDANPLVNVLRLDMSARSKVVANSSSSPTRRLLAASPTSTDKTVTEREWDELLEADPAKRTRLLSASSTGTLDSRMSDIRVAPLIKTKWSQSTWGDCTDIPVYNRFTPNYSVCGCVATAGAQIMKHFGMPTKSIEAGEYTCKINGKSQRLKMYGGTYDWNNMPLSYDETPNISTKQIDAIGKLTYDIGVAAEMSYTLENSGTGQLPFADNMRTVFGYSSSMLYNCRLQYNQHIKTDEQLFNAVFASIDAGCPVAAGVYGLNVVDESTGGHFILFDGYGYYNSVEYVHINFGWSGACNMWYNVFGELIDSSQDGPPYLWHTLGCVCYNIHPLEVGDVISGRVVDASGKPVVGATVTLSGEGISTVTKKSAANGIWYFRVAKPMTYEISAEISAASGKLASKVAVVRVQRSSSGSAVSSGVVANKWGVDLTLESESDVIPDYPVVEQVKAPSFVPTAGSFESSSLSVTMSCGTSGATIYYTRDGSTPTTSSTRYTGAVTINATTTFKALAVKSGMANSDVVVKTYTKNKPTISVADALDDTSRAYTASDTTLVVGQDEVTHDGADALKLSCAKTSGAKTSVTANFAGAGTLSFWWCDPSATAQYSTDTGEIIGYVNYFYCVVKKSDGSEYGSWKCAGPAWEKCEIPLPAGTYTVEWSVSAGYSIFAAARTSYVDEVSFAAYYGGSRNVSFNANGGSGVPEISSTTAAFGDKVKMSGQGTLVLDDHRFVGWAKSPTAVQAEYETSDVVQVGANDVVLYAVWKKILPVLVEIPQAGGEADESLSLYGNTYTAYIFFPTWANNFQMTGKNSNGGTTTLNLGNGVSHLSISGVLALHFSAGINDTALDRSFDLDMDAKNYPYVIRFHVVQKADVVTDKPKGLVVDGASSIVASSGATFGSQVVRRNGAVNAVSPTWEIVSGESYASVSPLGQLTAKAVTSPQTVTLRASYEEDGVECTAEREVTILPTCDLNTALDNTELTLQTGTGADAWFGQFDVSNDGTDAARASSALGGTPWIKTTVDGPATISFDCLMSADGGNTLYLVDNGKTNACAFSVPMTIPSWQNKKFNLLGEGPHVIEFVYAHEGGPTGNAGADAMWLDNLAVRPLIGGICGLSLDSKGWHLVSFSVLPDDPSPANVFADVADKIDQVVQGSKVWKPESGGRLTEVEIGVGYWVRTKTDNVSWIVAGAANPGVEISLSKGWNLVGYPLIESGSTAAALKSALNSGKVTKIVDGSKVYPGRLDTLVPGKGYWFYAPATCTITFDQD